MAIPVLKLNLAPPPTLWRAQHALIGWSVLGLGILALGASAGLTWRAYQQAEQMGRSAIVLSKQTQDSLLRQEKLQSQLRAINVQKELPRWKLAERILGERSSPWSRMSAELERSLVQDVRIRSLQRQRGADLVVVAKLKGEARSRESEAAFVESLQKNPYFAQVILERESERQGGGVEFEYTLPLSPTPPSYEPLPKYGPARAAAPSPAPKPQATPAPKPAQPATTLVKPAAVPQASLSQAPPPIPGKRPIRPSGEAGPSEAAPTMVRPTREVRR